MPKTDNVEHFEDGDVIIRQGDLGDRMYVVVGGQVQIYRTHDGIETDLASVRSGETFGELALFDNRARSASARAVGPVELRVITRDQLARMKCDPLLRQLLETLAHRLRATSLGLERLNIREVPEREELAALWESHTWLD